MPIISRNDFDINNIIFLFCKNDEEKIKYNYFFEKLNLSLNHFEKELLLRRIDLVKKGYFSKSELFDFFVPFNKIYRENFENDFLDNNNKENKYNINFDISKGTMIYINNLVNVVLKAEKDINSKKIAFDRDNILIENIFDEISNINIEKKIINIEEKSEIYNDYFNKEKLFKYLNEKLNIKLTDNELDLLIVRFDKLKRGKIKFLEFSDEMKYII